MKVSDEEKKAYINQKITELEGDIRRWNNHIIKAKIEQEILKEGIKTMKED